MNLVEALKVCASNEERLALLEKEGAVQNGLKQNLTLQGHYQALDPERRLIVASILAIGQGPVVFQGLAEHPHREKAFKELLWTLLEVERVYRPIGGIVGYHAAVLKLLEDKGCGLKACDSQFLHPFGPDISQESSAVNALVRFGIEYLPYLAEFYPIGGAGERLNLQDEKTGAPLPVAELKFDGRTLLEGLIRDLQAREYLYFKLTGKEVTVPLVLMTSQEKNNRSFIEKICREAHWFGRGKENFHFYDQPMVPVITQEGNWSLQEPLVLNVKPGGHGVLWKLAEENGVFDLLEAQGVWRALVRQINNPIAGLDYGLLAFTGKGLSENRSFGFASCERLLNTPEGVDVVVETPVEGGFEYVLTNVEYTEFEQRGIEDLPTEAGGTCSAYPSNTNILFADLRKVKAALERLPFPGMLINMKSKIPTLQPDGSIAEVEAGRLETTMQNIADAMSKILPHEASEEELLNLEAYITYNKRSKTISVAKTAHQPGKSLNGTPEGCYRDLLREHLELFKRCGLQVDEACILSYHPALGPLYAIIAQKVRGGVLAPGSELRLDLAEADIENLEVNGSLQIQASLTGKCTLKNVHVQNLGIDRTQDNLYWKNKIARLETLRITIEGDGEFYAEEVHFVGDLEIVVPAGQRMQAFQRGQDVEFVQQPIAQPTWEWKYRFDANHAIQLVK